MRSHNEDENFNLDINTTLNVQPLSRGNRRRTQYERKASKTVEIEIISNEAHNEENGSFNLSSTSLNMPPLSIKKKRKTKTQYARTVIKRVENEEQIIRLRAEGKKKLEDVIMILELNDCRQLLVKVSEKMPSLFLDMAEIVNGSTSTESSEPTEPTRSLDSPNNKLTWCVCGHCAQMTSEMENICCGMQPRACLSQLPHMDIYILDQMVLHLQQVYRNDIFALHAEDNDNINKAFRHASYRQFILWQFGRLIAGDRHVIPSCVLCRIRQTYPSELGVYTGYRPGRLF